MRYMHARYTTSDNSLVHAVGMGVGNVLHSNSCVLSLFDYCVCAYSTVVDLEGVVCVPWSPSFHVEPAPPFHAQCFSVCRRSCRQPSVFERLPIEVMFLFPPPVARIWYLAQTEWNPSFENPGSATVK